MADKPRSIGARIFISYAHRDGAVLAERLRGDLAARDFHAWLDTHRLRGGVTWTKEVEEALDDADVVLALLTAAAFDSEICRAEQLRALRKGKCVIPLRAQKTADVPLYLEPTQYRDLNSGASYEREFGALVADIEDRVGAALRPEYKTTYVTAPPLPVNYVERHDALKALRDELVVDGAGRHVALTALLGMGGIGKTVLAQALCHDEVVQQAFPDGIIWVTVKKEPGYDLMTRLREVGKALNDDLARYDTELGSINQYRSTLRGKAALIVLDDIWNAHDVEPFCAESPRSRVLLTTRDASVAASLGAHVEIASLLSPEESREVLARWSGLHRDQLPVDAAAVIHECGRLPLALSMVGAALRNKPKQYWKYLVSVFQRDDLERIRGQFPNYPYPNLFRAMQVSVDQLDAVSRERYLALAALLEDMTVGVPVLRVLWNTDEGDALETLERFVSLSLAYRAQDASGIRLQRLQLDYVRAASPHREALPLVQGAVRLGAHVIFDDPLQFASQVTGRLLSHMSNPDIATLVTSFVNAAPRPWFRLLRSALIPAGGGLTRTLEGHSQSVRGVAVSADARRAVSASADRTVRVWDVETGHEIAAMLGHTDLIWHVVLTGDGTRVISASRDHTLRIWDVETGRPLDTLDGHADGVNGVAISADARIAVSASADHTLKVWDLENGRERGTLVGHSSAVRAVALSADGRMAISASDDRTLKVWQVETMAEVRTLAQHTDAVLAVDLTMDGSRAVSASKDATLKVWNVGEGRDLRTLNGHGQWVTSVALSGDGRRAVSGSQDQTLRVWDVDTGRELGLFEGHADAVNGVAVSADGRLALSASTDRTVKVWDVTLGRALPPLRDHAARILGLSVTTDGRIAVSASADCSLKVWDVKAGQHVHTLTGHVGAVTGCAVSADGRIAVSGSTDRTLKVWELHSGREVRTLAGHSRSIRAVALSPDGRCGVSASDDGTLKVWDMGSGLELRTIPAHRAWARAVALDADGRRVVSGSDDCTVRVWQVDTGAELFTLRGHAKSVVGVMVSTDGRRAVSASVDNSLKVWDLDRGREVCTLAGHRNSVRDVSISPDGLRAVSASDDHTVKAWNVESGEEVATFTCDGVALCCGMADGGTVVAGDLFGRMYFLHLET